MKTFISFPEARDIVLDHLPDPHEDVTGLDRALGKTLGRPVAAAENIPPFDNSAMDGFAVRAQDVPAPGVCLPLAGEISAGCSDTHPLAPGTCVRIMTGAPLPEGANAVIPIEVAEVHAEENSVTFLKAASPGDHVRSAGQDMPRGRTVLEAGNVLSPADIAVLASLGQVQVPIARPPEVSIVTTGNELIEPSEALRPGKIRNANGPALAAQIATAGGQVYGQFHARDTREAVRNALEAACKGDMLVISGGVSVGDYDFVKEVLEDMGLSMLFWRVRQRPGKPLVFGLLGDIPVFGLPGNPVSSAVCFEAYVRPALAGMLGRQDTLPRLESAVLGKDIPKKRGLHHFVPGRARWTERRLIVAPAGPQGSHIVSSLALADGLIHLPESLDEAPAGMPVSFERLHWEHP
ncbi:MAG: molybdopterin molybdotransferase MoeA [Bacteroidetes bacterium SB0662_bin_6]|nr:molybdopterin molybdotransferase MoeA [Bacteroidetes bacterium SB0668_bin_1]MYE04679.1 molybdopterin molybdotransferase MoeA [Bacteroidetes bacterium SB0662_bin_6]